MRLISLLSLCLTVINGVFAMDETLVTSTTSPKMTTQQDQFIETQAGKIAYRMSEGKGTPIVFIHGNSASKEVFQNQFDALGAKYKLIAFDLPGHGNSDNALNPEAIYSFPGYAKIIIEALDKLGIKEAIFCGWSLGGHIAIDLLSQKSDLVKGLLITGTPPVPLNMESLGMGFKPVSSSHLTSQKEQFSEADAKEFLITSGFNPDEVPHFLEDAMRTNGNARHLMIVSAVSGVGANEKEVLETTIIPLAIIIGEKDPVINNDYIRGGVNYSSLKGIYSLDCGHAPHWEMSAEFNAILDKFAQEISGK